jgi:uncharacterized protein
VNLCCRFLAFGAVLLLAAGPLPAAERIPPAPPRYFNDYTETVTGLTAEDLNRQLEQYEKESSNQLLVAIYPTMESNSSVEDYTVRVAQAWKAGQKGKDNGAVLFVFKNDHKLYIQVGYGLEATLTDARAHEIVENILKPRFRAGQFDAGLRAAVGAMIAATKGEYRGTGVTHRQAAPTLPIDADLIVKIIIFVFVVLWFFFSARRGVTYTGSRRGVSFLAGSTWTGGSGSGSSWSGGGGGGGGFSGGGGSFGGGGAGGSW